MDDIWLPTLMTDTPQAGFELAIKLARHGVKATQPSHEVCTRRHPAHDHDSAQLIAASQVIALNFQTIAAANN
jgi:Hexameric tyrosine-coordinated heme protein (HTHP)